MKCCDKCLIKTFCNLKGGTTTCLAYMQELKENNLDLKIDFNSNSEKRGERMKRVNTVEEAISLLKQRKKVYITKEKENGYYTLIENCVSFCDSCGNILHFNTTINNTDLPLYAKDDNIKFEWGKFYKTAKGEKALYYAEHKDDKGNPTYFFCVDKCEEFRTNALGKDIDFDNDIVDYWRE